MKLKVTGLTAAVICVILLALDSFTYYTLRRHLMVLENNLVISHAQTVAQGLNRLNEEQTSPFGMFPIHHQLEEDIRQWPGQSILVLDNNLNEVDHVGQLSTTDMLNAFDPNDMRQSVPMKIGTDWYMTVAYPIQSPEGTLGIVFLSADINAVEDYLHRLLTVLIAGSIGALLLSAAGGYAVSAAAARPINQMIRLAGRIQADTSNERIPIPRGKDEVARLAETFNQMLDRIERAFQRQAEFVADASHEIRTPLTTIQGYADLLERWGKQDPSMVEKAIAVIRKETGRLRSLTNDMLTLADMESSQHALTKTCEVNQTLLDILEPYGLLHPEHPIHFEPTSSVMLAIAPEHFGRVPTNLIDNAIKYTPEGGRIEVKADVHGDQATVSVTDTGQGIPEEDLPHIFERFYRVDKARSRTAGGNGLGLSIVKELVELYGGHIRVSSRVQEGTTMTLSLPLAKQV